MKVLTLISTLFAVIIFTQSCQQQSIELTASEKSVIVDSAKAVLTKVFDYSNKLNYNAALKFYSADSDTRYVDNGTIYSSLEAMKVAYDQVGPTMELVENTIKSWDAVVLANNAVAFTLPINLRLKAKGRPEYAGQFVWSGILQQRNGKWLIIQSHESWLNYADVVAALTSPLPQADITEDN